MRKRVVEELKSGEYLIVQLAEKYGLTAGTISNWKYQIEMPEGGLDPKENELDIERIANEILDGIFTKNEAIAKYGLTKPLRIRYWVDIVRKKNWLARKDGKIQKSPILGMGTEKLSAERFISTTRSDRMEVAISFSQTGQTRKRGQSPKGGRITERRKRLKDG
jgi:hypothetical protein